MGATNEQNLQQTVENRFELLKQHGMKMSKRKTELNTIVITRKIYMETSFSRSAKYIMGKTRHL